MSKLTEWLGDYSKRLNEAERVAPNGESFQRMFREEREINDRFMEAARLHDNDCIGYDIEHVIDECFRWYGMPKELHSELIKEYGIYES